MNAIKRRPQQPFNKAKKAHLNVEMHGLFIYLCEHNLLFFLLATRNYREIQKKFSPKFSEKMLPLRARFNKRNYAKKSRRNKRIEKVPFFMNRKLALSPIVAIIKQPHPSTSNYINTQRFFVTPPASHNARINPPAIIESLKLN